VDPSCWLVICRVGHSMPRYSHPAKIWTWNSLSIGRHSISIPNIVVPKPQRTKDKAAISTCLCFPRADAMPPSIENGKDDWFSLAFYISWHLDLSSPAEFRPGSTVLVLLDATWQSIVTNVPSRTAAFSSILVQECCCSTRWDQYRKKPCAIVRFKQEDGMAFY